MPLLPPPLSLPKLLEWTSRHVAQGPRQWRQDAWSAAHLSALRCQSSQPPKPTNSSVPSGTPSHAPMRVSPLDEGVELPSLRRSSHQGLMLQHGHIEELVDCSSNETHHKHSRRGLVSDPRNAGRNDRFLFHDGSLSEPHRSPRRSGRNGFAEDVTKSQPAGRGGQV